RKNVEAFSFSGPYESRARSGRSGYRLGNLGRIPRPAVDARLAVGTEGCPMTQQQRPRPRGKNPPVRRQDLDEPVAFDPRGGKVRGGEPLARHRLHRVPPELPEDHT